METLLELMSKIIPILPSLPSWLRYTLLIWVIFTSVAWVSVGIYWLLLAPTMKQAEGNQLQTAQTQSVEQSPASTNIQIGRDLIIQAPTPSSVHTFSLAECSFDMILEIPVQGVETFRKAFPQGSGNLTVLLNISEDEVNQQAQLQLAGQWNGTSGMISHYSEDLIVYTLSEHRFTLLHKKPIIMSVPTNLTRLRAGGHYSVHLTAFPGFAIPLIPKEVHVRTHDGMLFRVYDFKGDDKGWYSGTLSL